MVQGREQFREGIWQSVLFELPVSQEWVIYKTESYQSAGYIGGDGQWYCCTGKRELLPVIAWRDLA